MERKAYPTDVSDVEWALVAPYLALMTEDAPQRLYMSHALMELSRDRRVFDVFVVDQQESLGDRKKPGEIG
jgi:hypothetical protein